MPTPDKKVAQAVLDAVKKRASQVLTVEEHAKITITLVNGSPCFDGDEEVKEKLLKALKTA